MGLAYLPTVGWLTWGQCIYCIGIYASPMDALSKPRAPQKHAPQLRPELFTARPSVYPGILPGLETVETPHDPPFRWHHGTAAPSTCEG